MLRSSPEKQEEVDYPPKDVEVDEAKDILEDARIVLCQTRDERNAMNAQRRVAARAERNMQILEEELRKIGRERYVPIEVDVSELDDDPCALAIMVNDVHFGASMYGRDEEAARFQLYVKKILAIAERHHANTAHVFLMGDLISGMIHKSIQITNRESVIQQVMRVAELVADFVYELEDIFDKVRVYSVPGNHSRIDRKDDALLDDRLDDLVFWYVRGVLAEHSKIMFEYRGSTLCEAVICRQMYVAVHGDYDEFTDAGCARLVSYLGYKPKAIFYAHRHTVGMREYNGVLQIQSGSMCGCGDDYTEKKRLKSDPALTVCVINEDGVESVYPVKLST